METPFKIFAFIFAKFLNYFTIYSAIYSNANKFVKKRCNFCNRLFFTYESVVNKDNFLNLIQYCKLEKYPNKKNKFRFFNPYFEVSGY